MISLFNHNIQEIHHSMKASNEPIPEEESDEIDQLKARVPVRQNEEKPIKKKRKLLSFEDEQEQEAEHTKIKKNMKMKDEGLKDINKSQNIQEQLREEYYREMNRLREELIEVEYSYWDGPNVIKKIRRKKRQTIKQILEVCRLELIENFQNVASVQARDLLFVIKDFIAPHEITMADIQILKLQTTKEDLLLNLRHVKIKKDGKDLTLSVNLDGPARIIERSRYQKNKANFPFCNWHTLNLREK